MGESFAEVVETQVEIVLTRRLLLFELGGEFHSSPILRGKGGLGLFVGARKFFRVMDEVKEECAHVKRCACKFPKGCGERRAAGAACRRNMLGKPDGVHAATAEGFVRILHQPETVMAVLNHVSGDGNPLAFIRGGRSMGCRLR